jgi:eukaryotic-like serine/threonine-protein kinase
MPTAPVPSAERAVSTLVRVPVLDAPVTIADQAFANTVAPEGAADVTTDLLDEPAFSLRYAPGELLGEGGMGTVRVASDHRIGRDVALKTMLAQDPRRRTLTARFLREACVQGQLEHPAIVPVYDLGRDPAGDLYFTMKRVRGVTFADIVERLRSSTGDSAAQYSRRKLLSAFASVCQAVHFAHTRGVVHRDLKPDNVMLGDFGEVYVLDWGIAKIVGTPDVPQGERPSIAAGADPGSRTGWGETVGTLGYMPPEQIRGAVEIDARADVYALGAILYELLCLEPLHAKGTIEALVVSTLQGADARASVRAPQRDVSPELEAICVTATALDPAGRFASVRDLLDALERFLDGDRDLERRRELATEHARSAAVAAREALDDRSDTTEEARRRALHHLGRALAFDASNREAIDTLVRLLTQPPRAIPAEAVAELRLAERRTQRTVATGATLGYLAWFLFLPFGFWMGVRDPIVTLIASALWAAAALSAYASLRRPDPRSPRRFTAFVATAVAAAATSAVCGPYVLVPTLAVINVALWLLLPGRAHRLTIVGLGWLTILVPAVLEWTHVVRFYHFHGGQVTIVPSMLDFPAMPTHAFLLVASLALVSVAALLIARFRDDLTEAETRLHLQAWQLKQLVPHEAQGGSGAP